MSKLSYQNFKNHIITRLTQVWLLSNKLKVLLNENKYEKKNELNELLEEDLLQEPDLMNIASEEGILTNLEYEDLQKNNPKRAKRIEEQINLKMHKVFLESDISLLENSYPDIVWSSLSIMTMSVFEVNIKLICRYINIFLGMEFDINEMNGRSIVERGKNFIQKIENIDYQFSTSQNWQKIRGHQTVRNLIIHNGSFIDSSSYSRKVISFMKNSDTSLSVNENRLVIGKNYVNEVGRDTQDWLQELFSALESSYPEIETFETEV
jgi:CDP-glycerol glycerophosphotransferase (TagB/SpsB family)